MSRERTRRVARFYLRGWLALAWLSLWVAPGHAQQNNSRKEAIDLGEGIRMEFALIPAGSFIMGANEDTAPDEDAIPAHRVTITQAFSLGVCEVTQEQWQKVMGANPSRFVGAKLPVETVSWNDCQDFLTKLGQLTGRTFSLPTEAQWEYASRAGSTKPWSFGKSGTAVGDYAWYEPNSDGHTQPVGAKQPNAWGLYDMHGNVWEWCADWYAKHTYDDKNTVDPTGPPTGESRVLRGGAWGDSADGVRSDNRNCDGPDGRSHGIGLRCVLLHPK